MFSKAKLFVALSYVALATFGACKNQEAPKQQVSEMGKQENSIAVPTKTDTIQQHVHVFSCPMHPEVTGKEGEKCPKCGMALVHHD
jgi:hypothetical protein